MPPVRARLGLLLLTGLVSGLAPAQSGGLAEADALAAKGLRELGAYSMLGELVNGIGPRSAGSKGAERAVKWGVATMRRLGLQNVREIPCTVRHWERGTLESLNLRTGGRTERLTLCALGNSVATPRSGITAEVVEAESLAEIAALGERARGKIVLLNAPMDPTLTDTFTAYGRAVGARSNGASEAAEVGAVGVLVRSMTLAHDDVPHTGAMRYAPDVAKIPAAALSVVATERLSAAIRRDPRARVTLRMNCRTLPDAPSASVVGEIIGSERPQEIVVVGGHLDSWDIAPGAHDDGAGVTQSLEALRLLKELGWRSKRTIRVVLFMNEENGGEGSRAVAAALKASGETAYAAIESDSGGFAPRGFGCSLDAAGMAELAPWLPALSRFGIERFVAGGKGGADIAALGDLGAIEFGLIPESQRYFDYHHTRIDTVDKVNPRELELGALSLAYLALRLAER